MPAKNYELEQSQYSRIYGVTERSVRTYQSEDAPLDDPLEMYQWFWKRRTQPPGFSGKTPEELLAAYQAEADPAASDVQIQLELSARIMEARNALWQVATFANKYREHFQRADDVIDAVQDAKCISICILGMHEPPPGNRDTWPVRCAELAKPVFGLEGFAKDLPGEENVEETVGVDG